MCFLAISCEELTHWKRPWCWERLGAGGGGDDRGWDGWMASTTRWTWIWVNSGRWWWTGRPVCCDSWGHKELDTTERLNWTELNWRSNYMLFVKNGRGIKVDWDCGKILKMGFKNFGIVSDEWERASLGRKYMLVWFFSPLNHVFVYWIWIWVVRNFWSYSILLWNYALTFFLL